jgi:hypothetical protein
MAMATGGTVGKETVRRASLSIVWEDLWGVQEVPHQHRLVGGQVWAFEVGADEEATVVRERKQLNIHREG